MVCWELEKQQRMKVAIENRQSMGFILSWYEAPGIREEQPRGDLTQLGSGERVLLPTGRESRRQVDHWFGRWRGLAEGTCRGEGEGGMTDFTDIQNKAQRP